MRSDEVSRERSAGPEFPADTVRLNASAVVDTSGGGWMIIGAREYRSRLVAAFVRDGCGYVSDYQLLVRPAPHQPGIIVLESAVDSAPQARRAHLAPELSRERRMPAAQLRGLLLGIGSATQAASAWRAVSRDQALAWLVDAAPDLNSDAEAAEPVRALLAACVARPAIAAGLDQDIERVAGSALRNLANAVDAIL